MELEYVTNHLSHFVGRSLENDEGRYCLLKKIMTTGTLFRPRRDAGDDFFIRSPIGHSNVGSGDLFEEISAVCFCDIPFSALSIHTSKYGKFGLAFDKEYLVKQGAQPVFYIPQGRNMENIKKSKAAPSNVHQYLDYIRDMHQVLFVVLSTLFGSRDPSGNPRSNYCADVLNAVRQCVDPYEVFAPKIAEKIARGDSIESEMFDFVSAISTMFLEYVKTFDDTLEENASNNYYYEREWRILGKVRFEMLDVATIFVPDLEYAKRLRDDMPEYTKPIYDLKTDSYYEMKRQ